MKNKQNKISSPGNTNINSFHNSLIKGDTLIKSPDKERTVLSLKQLEDKESEDSPQTLGIKPTQIKYNNAIMMIDDNKQSKVKEETLIEAEDIECPQEPPKQQCEAKLKKYTSKDSKDKDKSFTIISDKSVKPHKGDINITPKSTNSKQESEDHNVLHEYSSQQKIHNNDSGSYEKEPVKSSNNCREIKDVERKTCEIDKIISQLDKSKSIKPTNELLNNTHSSSNNSYL